MSSQAHQPFLGTESKPWIIYKSCLGKSHHQNLLAESPYCSMVQYKAHSKMPPCNDCKLVQREKLQGMSSLACVTVQCSVEVLEAVLLSQCCSSWSGVIRTRRPCWFKATSSRTWARWDIYHALCNTGQMRFWHLHRMLLPIFQGMTLCTPW